LRKVKIHPSELSELS